MKITRRQSGDRRWGLPFEFPLVDSAGFLVPADRRKLQDRRKLPESRTANTMPEEAEVLPLFLVKDSDQYDQSD
jgi:hypothetical protein